MTITRPPVPHLSVDLRRLPWIRPLAVDYAEAFTSLEDFFAGNPAEQEAWRAAIARAHACDRPRSELAAVITAQQERRDAPVRVRQAARLLASRDTVAVVTGQQAGVFGGPLYTLLKALTAIQLAARISNAHGVPAVPVFWIDAEDHDWNEVRTCAVMAGNLELQTIALGQPEGAGERPVGAIALDESICQAIDALRAALPVTEFTGTLLADLEAVYRPGAGMVSAFACWMERVLGAHGLVVYDASDPAAKPLVSRVFVHELAHPGRTAQLAAEAGEALRARGYHAQVTKPDQCVSLFHLSASRQPIICRDGVFVVGEVAHTPAAFLDRARRAPEQFSPNVLLRPIVQDSLFPTIAYVAGPNELAYLAQLKAVYAHFDVPMPLMYPRATATLVDAAAMRFLNRYPLPIEAMQPDDEALLNHLLESYLPASVEQAYQEAAASIDARMTALTDVVRAIDPTVEGAARSTLGRMQHDLQTLHAKIIHAAKRRNETLRRQYHHTRAQLFPAGLPQERTVGFVSFLNSYGSALVDRLLEALPLDLGRHWILSI